MPLISELHQSQMTILCGFLHEMAKIGVLGAKVFVEDKYQEIHNLLLGFAKVFINFAIFCNLEDLVELNISIFVENVAEDLSFISSTLKESLLQWVKTQIHIHSGKVIICDGSDFLWLNNQSFLPSNISFFHHLLTSPPFLVFEKLGVPVFEKPDV